MSLTFLVFDLLTVSYTHLHRGETLKFVPDRLKTPKMCRAAVDSNSYALYYLSLIHISLMLALSQDLSQNSPVEAREHIRRFHELFFTLSPDRAAIERDGYKRQSESFTVDANAFVLRQSIGRKAGDL